MISWSCKETGDEATEVSNRLPFYQDASFTPHWIDPQSDSLKNFHRIPTFSLLNQEGDTISEQDLNGKIVVADFFFTTCPGICPKMSQNMQFIQEAYLEDPEVLLISHSVTPELDSVPVLKQYAKNYAIKQNKWHLLTGDRSQIYRLGRQSYFVEEDLGLVKSEFDFLHTENFILLDQNRQIRGIYNGLNKASIRQLMKDIETLRKHRSQD